MANRTCSEPDCERQVRARGLCHRCYERMRRRSIAKDRPAPAPKPSSCSVGGCTKKPQRRGMCNTHYRKGLRLNEIPRVRSRLPREATLPERLQLVGWDVSEKGCWLWRGIIEVASGYGAIHDQSGKKHVAHRASYEAWVGPIPEGNIVRHKCDVRSCMNPDHLEVGTQADNMRDMSIRGRSLSYLNGTYGGVCRAGLHPVTSVADLYRNGAHDNGSPRYRCRGCCLDAQARARKAKQLARVDAN